MYIRQHFLTITKHRILVMKHCFKAGLYWQGLTHDLSKYSWTEFSKGCRYWQGNRSPNNAEREDTGVSLSWLHHKGRNRHHFEYWIDYDLNSKNGLGGMPMPRKYIAEMVMDRIAACKVYLGSDYDRGKPYEYFQKSRENLWFVHKNVKRDLGYLLAMLRDRGEDDTFRYIKYVYLKKGRRRLAKKKHTRYDR
ncbi:MAG: catalase [Eubacterium sp.]|nr:catalase [Eubacterium sp.]